MKGIILAGGEGTRLRPLTEVMNKHLLPVYDKPMIEYPIQTLKDMGCTAIVLVSGGEHIGGFAEYLGDGSRLDVDITYRVQKAADGVAGALKCAKGLVDGLFPVILGDNYYEKAPEMPDKPTIYTQWSQDASRFGVLIGGRIVEKPIVTREDKASGLQGGFAVTGLYVYDERVFDYAESLEPSKRGELEITDVNNMYLDQDMQTVELKTKWSDMGTFNSLLEVANRVKDSNI